MALTPLALQNEAVLRHIQAQPAGEPFASFTAIAEALGRDRSNLTKTLNLLAMDELITMTGENRLLIALTDQGRDQLAAIERANNPLAMLQASETAREGDMEVPPSMVFPDPNQPRRHFDDADLEELAEAIATSQWVGPILVRPLQPIPWINGDTPTGYPLTAGERRWRAVSRLIERKDPRWPEGRGIPIQIRDTDPKQTAIIALMENIHRSSLKPLEEAAGFHRLHTEFGVPTDAIAEAAGVHRRTVQQRLQLLELSDADKARLNEGRITVEQARKIVQDRPEPIQMTPAQLMLLVEVAAAIFPKGQPQAWKETNVDWTAQQDDLFEEVRKLGLIGFKSDFMTKLWSVNLTDAGQRAVTDRFPDFADRRAEILAEVRANGVSAAAAQAADAAGRFVTPWLNAPFEMSPADKEAVELRRQDAAAAEAARDERDRQAAEDARAGRAMLLAVRTFEAEANTMAVPDFVARYGAFWPSLGFRAPVRIDKPTHVHHAEANLVDADGNLIGHGADGREAIRRFYALGLNFASGFPPLSGPAPTAEELEDLAERAAFAADEEEGGD